MKLVGNITKQDLINYILEKQNISEQELNKLALEHKKITKQIYIPISIFNTKLSPLEAITRYLKENQNKKINEIARLLEKNPSAISLAYKKSVFKKFNIKRTNLFIPLEEFRKKNLSVLETVVNYLRTKLRLTEIANILNRDVRTIWTLSNRAELKQVKNKLKNGK